jgi:hypothetical protein
MGCRGSRFWRQTFLNESCFEMQLVDHKIPFEAPAAETTE